jgi:hypothetical protein
MAELETVTAAPEITPPWVSVTVPVILPETEPWASRKGDGTRRSSRIGSKKLRIKTSCTAKLPWVGLRGLAEK